MGLSKQLIDFSKINFYSQKKKKELIAKLLINVYCIKLWLAP
jgi:hypothetical protein